MISMQVVSIRWEKKEAAQERDDVTMNENRSCKRAPILKKILYILPEIERRKQWREYYI